MTLRRSAPHKRPRWIALLATVLLGMVLLATSAFAAVNFTFDDDDDGVNDEPGQKDLTAQASAYDDTSPFDFYTAWKWDDTSWSGKNTGDGCALFDAASDGFVDYAVCATIGGSTPVLQTVSVYSCSNGRVDRCTNPVLLNTFTTTASTYCTLSNSAPGQFGDAADTLIVCNITDISQFFNPDLTALEGGSLINTCSYPSREPNSDPSDCVKKIANLNTSIGTQPSGTPTWTATLHDTATMNPTTATGSVVFKLWGINTGGSCSGLIWESVPVAIGAGGTATTVGAAAAATSPNPTTVITDATTDADLVFWWTVDYTPTGAFNASTSACGVEKTTITPSSLTHVPAPPAP